MAETVNTGGELPATSLGYAIGSGWQLPANILPTQQMMQLNRQLMQFKLAQGVQGAKAAKETSKEDEKKIKEITKSIKIDPNKVDRLDIADMQREQAEIIVNIEKLKTAAPNDWRNLTDELIRPYLNRIVLKQAEKPMLEKTRAEIRTRMAAGLATDEDIDILNRYDTGSDRDTAFGSYGKDIGNNIQSDDLGILTYNKVTRGVPMYYSISKKITDDKQMKDINNARYSYFNEIQQKTETLPNKDLIRRQYSTIPYWTEDARKTEQGIFGQETGTLTSIEAIAKNQLMDSNFLRDFAHKYKSKLPGNYTSKESMQFLLNRNMEELAGMARVKVEKTRVHFPKQEGAGTDIKN